MEEQIIQQPVQESTSQPEQQKSNAWIWWVVGILVLLGIGVLVYFLLSNGNSRVLDSVQNLGGLVPQPPALPA